MNNHWCKQGGLSGKSSSALKELNNFMENLSSLIKLESS
jgi:hypothetical protein